MDQILKKQTDEQEQAIKAALKYIRDNHPAAGVLDRSHILQAFVEGFVMAKRDK